jgi:hypothetical protein
VQFADLSVGGICLAKLCHLTVLSSICVCKSHVCFIHLLTSVQQKGPKGADDPFTQADINCRPLSCSYAAAVFLLRSPTLYFAAQNLIVGGLLTRWSGLKVVGEENLAQVKTDYLPKQSMLLFPFVLLSLTGCADLVPAGKVPENLRSVPIDDVAIFIDPLDATKVPRAPH